MVLIEHQSETDRFIQGNWYGPDQAARGSFQPQEPFLQGIVMLIPGDSVQIKDITYQSTPTGQMLSGIAVVPGEKTCKRLRWDNPRLLMISHDDLAKFKPLTTSGHHTGHNFWAAIIERFTGKSS